jgi:hypothetical protein
MATGLALATLQSFPQLSSAVAYRVSANFNRENPLSVGAHCDFLPAGYRSTSLLHTVFLYFLGSVLSRFFFVFRMRWPTQYQRSTCHCVPLWRPIFEKSSHLREKGGVLIFSPGLYVGLYGQNLPYKFKKLHGDLESQLRKIT